MVRRAVMAVMAVTLLLGLLFAIVTPLWQTPDEPTHTAYVEVVAYQHRLPSHEEQITPNIYASLDKSYFWPQLARSIQREGGKVMTLSAAAHPPLYYIICAPVFWFFTPFGLIGQVFALRVFGIFMALGVVWLTYKTAEMLFPKDTFIQVLAPAIVGLQPMFLFTTAGVNNDSLTNLVFAAVIYMLVTFLIKGFDIRRAVVLGLLLGAGLATKGSFVVMIPIALFVLVFQAVVSRKLLEGLKNLGATVGGAIGSAFWLVFWNYQVVGNVVINAAGGNAPGWSKDAPGWASLLSGKFMYEFFFNKIGQQFWGTFGWLAIVMSRRLYLAIYGLCFLAAAGVAVWLARTVMKRELKWPLALSLLMLLGTILVMVVAVMRFDLLTGGGTQGRYLFAVWLPMAIFLATGVRGLTPDSLRRFVLPAASFTLVCFCLFAIFRYIVPFFYLT